ncbi:MAG: amidohydrolase [Erysipelotrichaceae bacterium]|nr:amidohydrolase [Erysipelotrichaceae bacterium]
MKKFFHNANIYTGQGFAKAFTVENGYFTNIFYDEPADMQDCEKIDLQGAFVCAGFNDSHMHLLNFGQSLRMAKLNEHTGSLSEMMAYMKEFIEDNDFRPGSWIRGRGWNQDYFEDVHRMPERLDLDQLSGDLPIMLTRACGHCCAVNSKVFEIAHIDKDTAAPLGGAIDYEKGLLYDNAMDLIEPYIPLPDKEELKQMILAGAAALNGYGITSCQSDDYCVFREIPFETVNEAFKELAAEGRLSVRVFEQSNFTELGEFSRFVQAGNITGAGDEHFKIGPLKLLGDGSLGGRTAHLSRPYADDPSTQGFSLFSDEQFNEMISYANRHGMSVAVHAIGDACLDKVLNAIDKALKECPREDRRHGIVHCQISRKDQLERMIALKTHIYAQSIFLDYDNHIVEKRVGKDLAATSYSWKTLKDHGLSVSNGSDAPVELPDALRGIECAVTRTSIDGTGPYLADQAFSVKEAIDSFTVESAVASFEESFKGRIKEGYLADFTVLKEDPFKADPHHIHEIPVISTWLGGNCVYAK